jgi:hypothetical protein
MINTIKKKVQDKQKEKMKTGPMYVLMMETKEQQKQQYEQRTQLLQKMNETLAAEL